MIPPKINLTELLAVIVQINLSAVSTQVGRISSAPRASCSPDKASSGERILSGVSSAASGSSWLLLAPLAGQVVGGPLRRLVAATVFGERKRPSTNTPDVTRSERVQLGKATR